MLNRKTFVAILNKIQQQFDKDNERAQKLSELYGSDIDPVNNQLLIESIWLVFMEVFSEDQIETIEYFCYEQNFGRVNGLKPEKLWDIMLKNINVVDAEQVSPQGSIH